MKITKIRLTKITIISLGLLNFIYFKANSQVQTKFFRPSMTTTFMKPTSSEATKIYAAFASTPMEARFDHRTVKNNTLNVTIPKKPELPTTEDPLELKKVMADYKKSVQDWQSAVSKAIVGGVSPVGKEVFGQMLSRTTDGNMSWDKIKEAAAYSATDNQALSAKGSKNEANVMEEIAGELLKRSYYVIYDVQSIKTYDQVYNERDAAGQASAAKTNKPYTPAKRTQEGWQIDFNYYVYRLGWNDSIMNIFGNDAWLDASITDAAERSKRISAFENFSFPFELAYSGSSIAIASQSNDAEMYAKLKIKRKSMDELLTELPKSMQDDMVSKGGRKVEDFKMRAPIFQEYPITVKLGSKEGLYYDERFYVYDMEQDKEGKTIKKRRGVLRASNIVDNATIATGQSPASTFRQEGGKTLYQGTLVELKEDFGFGLSVGYGLLDKFVGGVNVGAEVRIPKFLKGSAGWNKYLRGLYLNANVGFNPYNDVQILEDYPEEKYSGSSMSIGASISRETYILKKGNLYLMPEIGGGIFSASLDEYFSDGTALNAGGMYVNGGLGIGFHFGPTVSFFAKGGFNMKLGEPTWTDENDTEYTFNSEYASSSGFSKIKGISTPVYAGLRFRF
jgi:hypothetical protein